MLPGITRSFSHDASGSAARQENTVPGIKNSDMTAAVILEITDFLIYPAP
ncbi:MAG: hypothetical protein MJ177_06305 [Clostridia bacterium]|nr:hypothetical protein [Clostridia bacterium]